MTVDEFVESLAKCNLFDKDDDVTNQYALNAQTSDNLKRYLKAMLERYQKLDKNKRVLLVGEAPGHSGCALSGIPFTSEYIIANSSFFKKNLGTGYSVSVYPSAENTAKIVWDTLENYDFAPLMWNIFPFHPHEAGKLNSNRTPAKDEIGCGFGRIKVLMSIFDIDISTVYAVGKVAWDALKDSFGTTWDWEKKDHYIRHPSHGGKAEFEAGIKALYKEIFR